MCANPLRPRRAQRKGLYPPLLPPAFTLRRGKRVREEANAQAPPQLSRSPRGAGRTPAPRAPDPGEWVRRLSSTPKLRPLRGRWKSEEPMGGPQGLRTGVWEPRGESPGWGVASTRRDAPGPSSHRGPATSHTPARTWHGSPCLTTRRPGRPGSRRTAKGATPGHPRAAGQCRCASRCLICV